MTSRHSEIIEILKQIEASGCEEFHLRMGELELSLRRHVSGKTASSVPPRVTPQRHEPQTRPTDTAAESSTAPAATRGRSDTSSRTSSTAEADGSVREVAAPMGGMFYRRPAPDEPVFAEAGDHVAVGAPLCMIEVMKLFSTIYAEFSGRIVSFEVKDAESVEQGQALILIEPDSDGQ